MSVPKDSVTLRKRKRQRSTVLYLDIVENGKRRTESLGLKLTEGHTRAEKAADKEAMMRAEEIRVKRISEIQERKKNPEKCLPGDTRFYDFMQRIIDRKDGTTKTSWENCMKRVREYEPNDRITFAETDRRWAQGFRDYLDRSLTWSIDPRKRKGEKSVMAEGTKALMFQKFCTVFNMAVKEGVIVSNPTVLVKRFQESYAPREFLTQDELRQVISTPMPDELVCRAFLFSCFTGMRWSDIVTLRWRDIRPMNGRMRIVFKQRKTGGLEYLDLSDQAVRVLGDRGKDDDEIFRGITAIQNARIQVGAWVKAAGIDKHITFHCGRHTFAVMMLDLGVDLYTVSKLLGHKSIETTQVYAKILDKNKQSAVDRIPDFGL